MNKKWFILINVEYVTHDIEVETTEATSIKTVTTDIPTTIEDIQKTTHEPGIFRFVSCRKRQTFLNIVRIIFVCLTNILIS